MQDDAPERRFEALFRANYPAVRRYAFHRAIDGTDADDMVAETFLVAWRRLDHVPADDPLPWLLAVAANVHRNAVRGQRRRLRLVGRLARPEPVPPPDEPGDDRRAAIGAALRELPRIERELLTLVAWDGLTPAQAATVIGATPGATRVRLHRARRRFAAALEAIDQRPQPTTVETLSVPRTVRP